MTKELSVFVSEDGADAERVEMLTGYLRRELAQLDGEQVSLLVTGRSPAGTRAFEVAAIGGLLVALGDSAQALNRIITTVRAWLTRTPGSARTIRVEIAGDVLELSHASTEDQERLIGLFVSRHAQTEGSHDYVA